MGIKKFVAIVLVVSIGSLVPLQALAQIEPRITYDEWCSHLSELYSRPESTPQPWYAQFWPSMVVVFIGGLFLATEQALITATLLIIGGTLGMTLSLSTPRHKILVEINKWKDLGEPYFWFYPCE